MMNLVFITKELPDKHRWNYPPSAATLGPGRLSVKVRIDKGQLKIEIFMMGFFGRLLIDAEIVPARRFQSIMTENFFYESDRTTVEQKRRGTRVTQDVR